MKSPYVYSPTINPMNHVIMDILISLTSHTTHTCTHMNRQILHPGQGNPVWQLWFPPLSLNQARSLETKTHQKINSSSRRNASIIIIIIIIITLESLFFLSFWCAKAGCGPGIPVRDMLAIIPNKIICTTRKIIARVLQIIIIFRFRIPPGSR